MALMEQHLQPEVNLAFSPMRAQERLCHIECQGCGAAADVELEFFVPAALELRCLSCGGTGRQQSWQFRECSASTWVPDGRGMAWFVNTPSGSHPGWSKRSP